ncbi:glycosyltransferase family 2 protein [Candidatus Zixiibacteriota bacterium]
MIVAQPVITVGMVGRPGRDLHQETIGSVYEQLGPDDDLLQASVDESGSLAAACNTILREATGDVVAFISGDGQPVEGWLESVRRAFLDQGIDAVAGAVGPSAARKDRSVRPGGRLRWTGHLVSDYVTEKQAVTSLASGENCAVRRLVALKLGGFDEAFTSEWPHEDVEFFTRLIKTGGRMLYIPGARLLPEQRHSPTGSGGSPEEILEQEARHSRSMAAIFARHEAWALLIMVASHMLVTFVEVFGSRLPRTAPVRIAREMMDGVRVGVRPVTSPFEKGGKRK